MLSDQIQGHEATSTSSDQIPSLGETLLHSVCFLQQEGPKGQVTRLRKLAFELCLNFFGANSVEGLKEAIDGTLSEEEKKLLKSDPLEAYLDAMQLVLDHVTILARKKNERYSADSISRKRQPRSKATKGFSTLGPLQVRQGIKQALVSLMQIFGAQVLSTMNDSNAESLKTKVEDLMR